MILKMQLQVEFNRDIDRNKDYISPGGYEMVMNGKKVQFDFCVSYGNICTDERSVCTFQLEQPDYDSFPDFERVGIDELKNITEITECYIYTGEDGESDLKETEINSISFVISDSKTPVIEIPKQVISDYNTKLKAERRSSDE